MKIAYIEDDADSRDIFARKFREDGMQCDTFGSAEEALAGFSAGAYDVVVSDIRLSGMSGVDFLSTLRKRDVHTPCVLITAFSDVALTKRALNLRADFLLEKPFTYRQLKTVVQRVVEEPTSLHYRVDRGLEKLALTGRERDVAVLILKGLSNAEIARAAKLSEKTVKQYVTQIFEKAAVSSRGEFFSSIFPI